MATRKTPGQKLDDTKAAVDIAERRDHPHATKPRYEPGDVSPAEIFHRPSRNKMVICGIERKAGCDQSKQEGVRLEAGPIDDPVAADEGDRRQDFRPPQPERPPQSRLIAAQDQKHDWSEPVGQTVIEVMYLTINCHAGNGSKNRMPTIHMISTASNGAPAAVRLVSQRGPASISPFAYRMRDHRSSTSGRCLPGEYRRRYRAASPSSRCRAWQQTRERPRLTVKLERPAGARSVGRSAIRNATCSKI